MPVDAAQSDRNLDQAARESLTAHAFLPSLRSAWTGVDARPHMVIFWKEIKNPAQAKLGRGTLFTLVGQVLSNPCGLAKS
jgi:hypothetical protein